MPGVDWVHPRWPTQLPLSGTKTNSSSQPRKHYFNMRLSTRRSSLTICFGLNASQMRRWSTCFLTHSALESMPFLSPLQILLVSYIVRPHPTALTDNLRSKLTNSNRPWSSHHRRIHIRLPDGCVHHPRVPRKRSWEVAHGMHQRDTEFMAESEGCVALYRRGWWRACSKVLWEGVWDEEVCSWDRRFRDHDQQRSRKCFWWHLSLGIRDPTGLRSKKEK